MLRRTSGGLELARRRSARSAVSVFQAHKSWLSTSASSSSGDDKASAAPVPPFPPPPPLRRSESARFPVRSEPARWDPSGRWENTGKDHFMLPETYGNYFRVPNPATVSTKVVCTIGPSSSSRASIEALLRAGMTAARLNTAHGNYEYFDSIIEAVRATASDLGVICPIMLDTKGPEIRVLKVVNGAVMLENGAGVTVDGATVGKESTAETIHINYKKIGKSVKEGDVVLLDDGRIALAVRRVISESSIYCRVISGGELKSNKGVNLPGCDVFLPHVTEKDERDIAYAVSRNIEYIAHSFTRSGEGIRQVRAMPGVKESGIHIIAKVESQEGLDNFEDIMNEADGIMVARGDLGVEIPLERVCSMQKRIIRRCNERGRFVITATEMLDSMMHSVRPTRAEASDVANAVFDGTDCVMLSGETAMGKNPVQAVQVMTRICKEAELDQAEHGHASFIELGASIQRMTARRMGSAASKAVAAPPPTVEHAVGVPHADELRDAFAKAAVQTAQQIDASIILCVTRTGDTARILAKHHPNVTVYALSTSPKVCAQIALYRSIRPLLVPTMDRDQNIPFALRAAKYDGLVKLGSRVLVLYGSATDPVMSTTSHLETFIVTDKRLAEAMGGADRMFYTPGSSLVTP